MMGGLVFMTGASGFIGSSTAIRALKEGYRLRICLRKHSSRLQAVLAAYGEQVEYIIIPNMKKEAAFRGSLDGTDYIIHIAHPIPGGIENASEINDGAKVVLSLLKEAARVSTIKKVAITSSLAALMPFDEVPPNGIIRGKSSMSLLLFEQSVFYLICNNTTETEGNGWNLDVDVNRDFNASNHPRSVPLQLYHASKLLANKATWDFYSQAKPSYDLVVLYPSSVYGRNPLQSYSKDIEKSSNGLLWNFIMTGTIHPLDPLIPGVHILDVVEAHVRALSNPIATGSYVLSGDGRNWREVTKIIQRDYPGIGVPIQPGIDAQFARTDGRKAELELGVKWRSWDQMIKDVVEQQLELANIDG